MMRNFHSTLLASWVAAVIGLTSCLADALPADDSERGAADEGRIGSILLHTVLVEDQDDQPLAAGQLAARKLLAAIGDAPLQAVLVSECFEDLPWKQQLLKGIASVIPKERIYGTSTYGSFTQHGTAGFDSVSLLGIAGDGIAVSSALVTDMEVARLTFEDSEPLIKERLHAAGKKLTDQLRRTDQDRLLILLADAHSPKNRYLVEGVQQVVGPDFPITGGSANRNAGQAYVYYRGEAHADSAVALMLSGDFQVSLSGRKAMENDQVIASAKDGAAEALAEMTGQPLGVLAFNCAGRRGRLHRPEDEWTAIQQALGEDLTLFGCYCAGEVGPLDPSEQVPGVLVGGSGWHVMFTVLGR